jgi:hypothetical protein
VALAHKRHASRPLDWRGRARAHLQELHDLEEQAYQTREQYHETNAEEKALDRCGAGGPSPLPACTGRQQGARASRKLMLHTMHSLPRMMVCLYTPCTASTACQSLFHVGSPCRSFKKDFGTWLDGPLYSKLAALYKQRLVAASAAKAASPAPAPGGLDSWPSVGPSAGPAAPPVPPLVPEAWDVASLHVSNPISGVDPGLWQQFVEVGVPCREQECRLLLELPRQSWPLPALPSPQHTPRLLRFQHAQTCNPPPHPAPTHQHPGWPLHAGAPAAC